MIVVQNICKAVFVVLSVLCWTGATRAEKNGEQLSNYVEPRIGTAHCRYFHFAPGALPFGMAKPGPSTNGHLGNKDAGRLRAMTIETCR